MELIERLEKKAKAGVSNPALVTLELINAALLEADELIGEKSISDTVKLDIANFRLMLMIKKDAVEDTELDLYSKALKIVDKASLENKYGEVESGSFVKVGRRDNQWA